ncbi:MAG: outer membrane beta-barrel protein [Verrucomicrobia bacterium]|nr:outer membrane beta-barrel protein [Verrucomicrobiota bacterium]
MIKVPPFVVAILVASAAVAFAGGSEEISKNVVAPAPPPVSLYRSNEWQFDIFGAYAPSGPDSGRYLGDHAWGGGSAVNYFFTRNFGLSLGGDVLDGTGRRSGDVSGDFGLNFLARLPIGNTPLAPYAYGGVGGFVTGSDHNRLFYGYGFRHGNNDDIFFKGQVGLGLEYRFSSHIGAFTDGGYNFVDASHADYGLVRAGIRFAF